MSYCRWSCLNGYSDVYVYEDVHGGWTTHVANKRPPPGAPENGMNILLGEANEDFDAEKAFNAYKAAQEKRSAWEEKNPHVEIDHPEAGKSFNHDTPGECAENLERLADEGFIVPRWAITNLKEEQHDQT